MTDAVVEVWTRETSRPVGTPRARGAVPAAGMDVTEQLEQLDRLDLLDAHERERWSRLGHPSDATAYLRLHVLARTELGRILGCPPGSLRFDRTCPDCGRQHGAPRLLDDPGLHVSLSRSGPVVALAVSRSGPVGIDVEQVERTQFAGFAQVALHPDERAAVLTAADAATSWVRKEAALKSLGVGLRVDPAAFTTPTSGVPFAVVPGLPEVTVRDVEITSTYAAAVALAATAGELTVRRH